MNYLFFFSGKKNQKPRRCKNSPSPHNIFLGLLHPFSHSLVFLLANPVALRLQSEQKYKLIRVLKQFTATGFIW